MSQANEVELLMLGLINEERTSRGLDPVTINADLNESSEDHSQWMLDNDVFSHTGVGGSSARARIEDAGYELEGNWRTAENIGWQSERGEEGIADDVADIHVNLMNSPGHRANLLNPDLEEIGIGVETGDFRGYDAVMITQNFGTTDAISDVPELEGPQEAPVAEPEVQMVQMDEAPEMDPVAVVETAETETPDVPFEDDVVDDSGSFFNVTTGRVVNSVTSTTVARTGEDPVTVTTETRERSENTEVSEDVFDFFDFDFPGMDDGADNTMAVSVFEGVVSTPDGTQTMDTRAAFETLIADIMEDFGLAFDGFCDFA